MKLRVLMAAVVLIVLSFGTGTLYAANSDRFVNGNLSDGSSKPEGKPVKISDTIYGVGTTSPTEKTEINDKTDADGNSGVDAKTPEEKSEINGN